MSRLQKGDEQCYTLYKDLFCSACPKFISPVPSISDEPSASPELAHQLNLFLIEVRQQSLIPTVRSFLKLYTTISISKLAGFLSSDFSGLIDEDTLRTHLICVKHKTRNLMWTLKTPVSGGQLASSSSDIDFYVEQDMIHIANNKVSRRYGEYFMRHILKFEEIQRDLLPHRSDITTS